MSLSFRPLLSVTRTSYLSEKIYTRKRRNAAAEAVMVFVDA